MRSQSKPRVSDALIERIANNDDDALHELYLASERAIFAFVLSIVKNPDDAADITQETFIKVRGAAHLYIPMGKPMAWLFTIARNLSLTLIRERGRKSYGWSGSIETDELFSYEMDREDKLILESSMNILNDDERVIILLHAVSGYKHRELAQALNLPLSTVLSKYNRGLKKLRQCLCEKGVSF